MKKFLFNLFHPRYLKYVSIFYLAAMLFFICLGWETYKSSLIFPLLLTYALWRPHPVGWWFLDGIRVILIFYCSVALLVVLYASLFSDSPNPWGWLIPLLSLALLIVFFCFLIVGSHAYLDAIKKYYGVERKSINPFLIALIILIVLASVHSPWIERQLWPATGIMDPQRFAIWQFNHIWQGHIDKKESVIARIKTKNYFRSLAFVPGRNQIVAGGTSSGKYPYNIAIIDIEDSSILRKILIPIEISYLAFSPDGRYLACSSSEGYTTVINFNTGKREKWIRRPKTLPRMMALIAMAFSPDNRYLAAVFSQIDGSKSTCIYDLRNQKKEVKEPDYTVHELEKLLTIDGFCNAIDICKYHGRVGPPFRYCDTAEARQFNKICFLLKHTSPSAINDLSTMPDLYDWVSRKVGMERLPPDAHELANVTQSYRTLKKFKNMSKIEQQLVQQLNHIILEEFFSQEKPVFNHGFDNAEDQKAQDILSGMSETIQTKINNCSPDKRYMVRSKNGIFFIQDRHSTKKLIKLKANEGSYFDDYVFSNDGHYFAIINSGELAIWDLTRVH